MSQANADRPPAVRLMRNLGLEPDPWQVEVLEAGHPRLLLNCCRQAGKSTVVALLGLAEAVFVPGPGCCSSRAATASPPSCSASSPTSTAASAPPRASARRT